MLITPSYAEQNRLLHESRHDYGISGAKHAKSIRELAQQMGTQDILDYGCGKRTLEDAIGFEIQNYDPAIPGCEARPRPADIVVCTDVLEHIEPECVDEVLDDIASLTKKMAFLTIATQPAVKTLPDGRNTHLIVQGIQWWLPKLWNRMTIGSVHNLGGHLLVLCGRP